MKIYKYIKSLFRVIVNVCINLILIYWRFKNEVHNKKRWYKRTFSKSKIEDAVYKASINSEGGVDRELAYDISRKIANDYNSMEKCLSVEEIQDIVEVLLMESNRKDIAKHYILYRERRSEIRTKAWEFDELQKSIWKNKYRHNGESFDEWIKRISNNSSRISKLIRQKDFYLLEEF